MGEDKTYTLNQARIILRAEDCLRDGHTLDQVQTSAGLCKLILCGHCGASWTLRDRS